MNKYYQTYDSFDSIIESTYMYRYKVGLSEHYELIKNANHSIESLLNFVDWLAYIADEYNPSTETLYYWLRALFYHESIDIFKQSECFIALNKKLQFNNNI